MSIENKKFKNYKTESLSPTNIIKLHNCKEKCNKRTTNRTLNLETTNL